MSKTIIFKGQDLQINCSPTIGGAQIDYSEVTDFVVSIYQRKDDVLASMSIAELIPKGSPQDGFTAPFLASSIDNVPEGSLYAQIEISIYDPNYTDPRIYVLSDIYLGELKDKA